MFHRNILTALLVLGLPLGIATVASASSAQREQKVPAPPGSKTNPLSVLQANRVFARMASQPHIAFNYVLDGCSARAHLMIRKMNALGIQAGKVWAFPPTDHQSLEVATPKAPGGLVDWCYHVAPVVRVHTGHRNVDMVIDPSLFKHPVTVAKWKRVQKTTAGHLPVVSRTAARQPPILPNGTRAAGSYSPMGNPQNPDDAALQTMARYQRLQHLDPQAR
jgi:hypothetical protein